MTFTLTRIRVTGAMPGGMAGQADVLGTGAAEHVNLDTVWDELERVTQLYNAEQDALVAALTYKTTEAAEASPQDMTPEPMEHASEYGTPRAIGPDSPHLITGFTLRDYDVASRYSARFLRDATRAQIDDQFRRMLRSDRARVHFNLLQRVFDPTEGSNEYAHRCFGAWSADSVVPPSFMGKSFDGNHTHYIASGSADLDSEDVELLTSHVAEHGYNAANGATMLLLTNPAEAEVVTAWRAGVTNANSKKAKHDFIPSALMPPRLSAETVVGGAVPNSDYNGLKVLGSYGSSLLTESYAVPAGYVAAVATFGPNSERNAIGFREHPQDAWQGVRLLEGNQRRYPIVESFMARTFGLGFRRRGQVAVLKLTAGSYAAPTAYNV